MPTRLIREGIINSDRVNELDWAAEVFYRRLLNKVDDHGLYDARLSVLRTSLYPVRVDRVREADCSRWLAACEKAGLIVLYEAEGKPFLKALDTRWQTRSEPKYPAPDEATVNTCKRLQTPVHLVVDGDVDVVVDEEKQARRNGSRLPPDWQPSAELRTWAAHKRPDLDIGETVEKFRDHWLAKPGKDGRKLDWDRTFRNWVRGERTSPRGNGSTGSPKTMTCDYRGEPFDPSREPCGIAGAKRGSLYGGRPLCAHHQQALDAPLPKSAMPADVRTALAGLVAKVTQ